MNPIDSSREDAHDSDSTGIRRRTIMAGAAWTIPVVSLATASPALAASNDLTLAFDRSAYNGQPCGTISGTRVRATRGGAAAPGESVTMTLADGYRFADGSTSHTDVTGSDGWVPMPDIKVPSRGGDSTFNASSGPARTTAGVSSPRGGQAYSYNSDGDGNGNAITSREWNVPDGATPVGFTAFIDRDGVLWDNGRAVADGVKSATGRIMPTNDGAHLISYVKTNGQAYSYNSRGDANGNAVTSREWNVPDGATPVGWTAFLDRNGVLWSGGNAIADGVGQAIGQIDPHNSALLISYVKTSGVAYSYNSNGDGNGNAITSREWNVPDGATPIGWTSFLDQKSVLWDTGKAIADGVWAAVGLLMPSTRARLASYIKAGC